MTAQTNQERNALKSNESESRSQCGAEKLSSGIQIPTQLRNTLGPLVSVSLSQSSLSQRVVVRRTGEDEPYMLV